MATAQQLFKILANRAGISGKEATMFVDEIEDVTKFDTEVALLASAGIEGSIYYAKDTKNLFISDGAVFTIVGGSGGDIVGTVDVGDVGVAEGSLTVTGGLTSANADIGTNSNEITINYPSMVTVPVVGVTIQSQGDFDLDNNLVTPVIFAVTAISFKVYLLESPGVVTDIMLHVILKKT
jgi:hypothetical protein